MLTCTARWDARRMRLACRPPARRAAQAPACAARRAARRRVRIRAARQAALGDDGERQRLGERADEAERHDARQPRAAARLGDLVHQRAGRAQRHERRREVRAVLHDLRAGRAAASGAPPAPRRGRPARPPPPPRPRRRTHALARRSRTASHTRACRNPRAPNMQRAEGHMT